MYINIYIYIYIYIYIMKYTIYGIPYIYIPYNKLYIGLTMYLNV